MQLYLVRPGRAKKRSSWAGSARLRPLARDGVRQARDLVDLLGSFEVGALACGSALRCRQTLEPLASSLGRPLHVDDRLDRGVPADTLVARAAELGRRGAVLCLHRGELEHVVRRIGGVKRREVGARCERGAAWAIGGRPPVASYLPPALLGAASESGIRPLLLRPSRASRRSRSRVGQGPRVAVLDLGSTSFHLLVAEPLPDGTIRRVARERVMLRMGAELARCGAIRPRLVERSVAAVQALRAVAEDHGAEQLATVATAALRDATNGPAVLAGLQEALGGPVHVLSGEEEARVIYRAIRSRIALAATPTLGLDLGGGSLEVVVGEGDRVLFESTLPLGVARLHGEVEPADPWTTSDLRRLRGRLRRRLAPIAPEVKRLAPEACVAVGGTARAVGRLLVEPRGEPGRAARRRSLRGLEVDRKTIAGLARALAAASHDERIAWPGMSVDRTDLLPVGAEILRTTLRVLDQPRFALCDWGLREGVILELWGPGARRTGASTGPAA